jgi:hypothetical protein
MQVLGVLMGPAENDPTAQVQLAAFRGALTKRSRTRLPLAISPPTGKLTRNFSISGQVGGSEVPIRPMISGLSRQIPYSMEQGIF